MNPVERLRKRSGLSAEKLAKMAGVGLSTVRTLEDGGEITPKKARLIASVLGVHWTALYPDGCETNEAS